MHVFGGIFSRQERTDSREGLVQMPPLAKPRPLWRGAGGGSDATTVQQEGKIGIFVLAVLHVAFSWL